MQKQKIEFNIPANLHFSSLVRNIAEEVFSFAHFSKEWCNRLKLVVDELFMNAVRYGSTEDKSTVHIVFSYDDGHVGFEIEDDGTGSEKKSVEELKTVIQKNASKNDVTRTSGRGLALITSLWTDKLEVKNSSLGGIAISFVKKIETAPPSPPALVKIATPETPKVVPIQPEKKPKGPEITIRLHGQIDQINIEKLTLPVEEQIAVLPEEAILILDFKEVDYINSTFIGHLASWYNNVKNKNGQIVVKNANNQIKDILDLVGLARVLNIK